MKIQIIASIIFIVIVGAVILIVSNSGSGSSKGRSHAEDAYRNVRAQ